jgi:hypothetical protein
MLVAKRHFVTRQNILATAITLTGARGADLRPNYPLRSRHARASILLQRILAIDGLPGIGERKRRRPSDGYARQ